MRIPAVFHLTEPPACLRKRPITQRFVGANPACGNQRNNLARFTVRFAFTYWRSDLIAHFGRACTIFGSIENPQPLTASSTMTSDSTKSLVLKLLKPNVTADQRRQAAIEMHKAIYGTEPTDQEITRLEEVAARYGEPVEEVRELPTSRSH
jgi:hypothetical protein